MCKIFSSPSPSMPTLIFTLCVFSIQCAAFGQQPSTKKDQKNPGPSAKQPSRAAAKPPVTGARLAELKGFVEENHADLQRLLRWLEFNRPGQYQRAMQSLDATYKRLTTLKERDPKKYQLSLEHWRVKSRVQLVAAEITLNDLPPLRENLEKLVSQEVELRSKLLQLDADRMQARLDKLNEQLNKIDGNRETEIQRQIDLAIKATKRFKPSRKSKAKPNRKKQGAKQDGGKPTKKSSSGSKDDK